MSENTPREKADAKADDNLRIKAYKTQLRTTEEQRETFRQWAGCTRYIYNWALEKRISYYEETGETLSAYEQDKAVTQLKKDPEHEWLSEPPRRVLYYAIQNLDAAFQHFFRRVTGGGQAPGFPRFKSRDRSKTSFTVYGDDCRFETARIRLPKIGWVPLEEKGYIPADAQKYGEITVSRDVDKWYVSVAVHEEIEGLPETGEALAVHPGVNKWIELSSTRDEPTLPAESLAFYKKRLARQQKKLARKEKGSHNRARLKKRIGRTHRKIRHLRENATHQATAYICYTLRPARLVAQKYDVRQMLADEMEDLPVSVRRQIRESIANANMGEMLRQLRYKSAWAGIEHIEVGPDVPISKRCSRCGYVVEDFGTQKTFCCDECGFEAGREKNAAQNLLMEMEKALAKDVETDVY